MKRVKLRKYSNGGDLNPLNSTSAKYDGPSHEGGGIKVDNGGNPVPNSDKEVEGGELVTDTSKGKFISPKPSIDPLTKELEKIQIRKGEVERTLMNRVSKQAKKFSSRMTGKNSIGFKRELSRVEESTLDDLMENSSEAQELAQLNMVTEAIIEMQRQQAEQSQAGSQQEFRYGGDLNEEPYSISRSYLMGDPQRIKPMGIDTGNVPGIAPVDTSRRYANANEIPAKGMGMGLTSSEPPIANVNLTPLPTKGAEERLGDPISSEPREGSGIGGLNVSSNNVMAGLQLASAFNEYNASGKFNDPESPISIPKVAPIDTSQIFQKARFDIERGKGAVLANLKGSDSAGVQANKVAASAGISGAMADLASKEAQAEVAAKQGARNINIDITQGNVASQQAYRNDITQFRNAVKQRKLDAIQGISNVAESQLVRNQMVDSELISMSANDPRSVVALANSDINKFANLYFNGDVKAATKYVNNLKKQ